MSLFDLVKKIISIYRYPTWVSVNVLLLILPGLKGFYSASDKYASSNSSQFAVFYQLFIFQVTKVPMFFFLPFEPHFFTWPKWYSCIFNKIDGLSSYYISLKKCIIRFFVFSHFVWLLLEWSSRAVWS